MAESLASPARRPDRDVLAWKTDCAVCPQNAAECNMAVAITINDFLSLTPFRRTYYARCIASRPNPFTDAAAHACVHVFVVLFPPKPPGLVGSPEGPDNDTALCADWERKRGAKFRFIRCVCTDPRHPVPLLATWSRVPGSLNSWSGLVWSVTRLQFASAPFRRPFV